MWITVAGVDHSTAPIALRERLACTPEQAARVLAQARGASHDAHDAHDAQEFVLLSTCNRMELYAAGTGSTGSPGSTQGLLSTLSAARQLELADLQKHSYCLSGKAAVSHLFEVACGLRSLVLGESQIQGQIAEALELSLAGGFAGPITSALFRAALVTGKRARSETAISRSATSISHVAVQLARRYFPRLAEARVLLIGSGRMSELAARSLRDNGAAQLTIINRTLEHAVEMAQRYGAAYRPFAELGAALAEADVVISSTGAPGTIISADLLRAVQEGRCLPSPLPSRHRPACRSLLLIDIALPRDIDSAAGKLAGVHLYNMDDLQAGVSLGMQQREQEVARVNSIIDEELVAFEEWLRARSVSGLIRDQRYHAEELRRRELARTLRQVSSALSPREIEAIDELSKSLVNKLLHTPTLRLKQAAVADQGQVYSEAFQYLFDVEVHDEQTYYDWDTRQQTGDDPDPHGDRTPEKALAEAGNLDRTGTHQG